MLEPFLSEIALFSFNFPPKGWAFCDGQLLPINQNQVLFSLLGTTYGGNGQTNFALPDLRGRVPIGVHDQNHPLGEGSGVETVTIVATAMPQHTHALDVSSLTATARCGSGVGNVPTPVDTVPAVEVPGDTLAYSTAAPDANMSAAAATLSPVVSTVGGSQPHENRQPYLGLNYCIALQGVFPSQS